MMALVQLLAHSNSNCSSDFDSGVVFDWQSWPRGLPLGQLDVVVAALGVAAEVAVGRVEVERS